MKTLISTLFIVMYLLGVSQNKITQKKYNGNLDMMNYISLNEDEKDILYEILLVKEDLEKTEQELTASERKINELNRIVTLSKEFKDIHSKANRKNNKLRERTVFLKSDIQEFQSINNKLIYNIYEQKLNNKSFLQHSKNVKTVRSYVKKAKHSYKIAEKYDQKIDNINNDNEYIKTLEKANEAYKQAILNQRYAIALCSNLDLAFVDANTPKTPNDNLAQNNPPKTVVKKNSVKSEVKAKKATPNDTPEKIAKETLATNSVKTEVENADKITNTTQNHCPKITDENIVFRIQIGAFINDVDKNKLNGLTPLFIDNSDKIFNKVLVGEHRSYRSAIRALRIIQQTTEYKDAFLVAYCSGKRKPVKKVMEENINEEERMAYISYRNNILQN